MTIVPTKEKSILGVDPVAARSHLLIVAQTLKNDVLPDLTGPARSATNLCIAVVTRLAQQVAVESGEMMGLLPSDQPDKVDMPSSLVAVETEIAAFDAMELQAMELLDSLDTDKAGTRSIDRDRIEQFLRCHELGEPALRVTQAIALAGGRSKQTLLVSQEGSNHLPHDLIIRQDWLSTQHDWASSVISGMDCEFRTLQLAFAGGIQVPQPLLFEKSAEPLGAPFIVVACSSGKQEGDLFHPPKSEVLALQLAEQLGRLHSLDAASLSGILPTRSYTKEQLQAELAQYSEWVGALGGQLHSAQVSLDWMEKHISQIKGPKVMLHGDLAFHNIMVDGDQLSAILDWELVHFGNPAQDLGYCKYAVEKMTSWPKFKAAYQASGGPPVDDLAVNFYALFSNIWLYATLLQARAGIYTRDIKDVGVAHFSAHFMPMLKQRMAHEVAALLRTTN